MCSTFLLFSEVGLRMVSSGLLGLGFGDSQELKKFMMKVSKCWPFCGDRDHSMKIENQYYSFQYIINH